jgi:hypothetical protein
MVGKMKLGRFRKSIFPRSKAHRQAETYDTENPTAGVELPRQRLQGGGDTNDAAAVVRHTV